MLVDGPLSKTPEDSGVIGAATAAGVTRSADKEMFSELGCAQSLRNKHVFHVYLLRSGGATHSTCRCVNELAGPLSPAHYITLHHDMVFTSSQQPRQTLREALKLSDSKQIPPHLICYLACADVSQQWQMLEIVAFCSRRWL